MPSDLDALSLIVVFLTCLVPRVTEHYQALLRDARSQKFDVVVAESLDRLSRDQEHVAGLYKQLSFPGVLLVTIGEGQITELHVGLKGAMSALYLKDLAQKTRRGLEGRVRQGRSAGGISYGYRIVRSIGPDGAPTTGEREVDENEAGVVCRVFAEFASGASPRAIAKALNDRGEPGPRGVPWCGFRRSRPCFPIGSRPPIPI